MSPQSPSVSHPRARGARTAVAVRCRASGERLELDPALLIGAGGEARVFALDGDGARVAKVYHEPDPARHAKVEAMLLNPPGAAADGSFRFAWPADVLLDEGGAFAGFVMPRAEGPRVFELYNPATRRERAPLFHHALLHRAARNLAAAFAALHGAGYVVGDVNESNVLAGGDGAVTLVDADSFQVPDRVAGTVHRSRVGKPEFTPPELQGVSFEGVDRTPEHDGFGLAVVLFHLLMEGTHPFAGRYPGLREAPPVEQRIREGHFAYAGRADLPSRPPRLAPPFGTLHPALQALFLRCFEEGHADPSARPAAAEWAAALERAEESLVACEDNPQHRYGRHLGNCPWCERAALLGGRDPFPGPGAKPVPRTVRGLPGSERPWVPQPAPARPAPAPLPPPPPPWFGIPPRVADHADWLSLLPAGMVFAGGMSLVTAPIAAIAAGLGVVAFERARHRAPERQFLTIIALLTLFFLLSGAFGGREERPRETPPAEIPAPEPAPPPAEPAPPPIVPEGEAGGGATDAEVEAEALELSEVDQMPVLLNREEIGQAMSAAYPPELRDAGAGGVTEVRFVVDGNGRVVEPTIRVQHTSDERFSQAARIVVLQGRFEPATLHGRPVAAWVVLPITWQVRR